MGIICLSLLIWKMTVKDEALRVLGTSNQKFGFLWGSLYRQSFVEPLFPEVPPGGPTLWIPLVGFLAFSLSDGFGFGEERWGDQWGVSGRTGLGIYSPGFLQATGSGQATSHGWVNRPSRILLGDFHFFWPLRQRDGKSSLSQPQPLVPSPGVSLLAYAFVIIPFT